MVGPWPLAPHHDYLQYIYRVYLMQMRSKPSCYIPLPLLWREIPMAWGTTTNSLTPEINPFQYAIEIKCLTLKDQTSYLIPYG